MLRTLIQTIYHINDPNSKNRFLLKSPKPHNPSAFLKHYEPHKSTAAATGQEPSSAATRNINKIYFEIKVSKLWLVFLTRSSLRQNNEQQRYSQGSLQILYLCLTKDHIRSFVLSKLPAFEWPTAETHDMHIPSLALLWPTVCKPLKTD